jgi:mannose-6-phosphate isomerase-like protein (cupin superfamily)
MSPEEIMRMLMAEGYKEVYIWQDGPHAFYPEHAHGKTTLIILEGLMWVKMNRETILLTPGKRLDIPANAMHEAKMGLEGCTYVVGEN